MSRNRAVRVIAAIALVAVSLGGVKPAGAAGGLTVTAEILRGGSPTTVVRRGEAVTIRVSVTNGTSATATVTGVTLPTRTGLAGTAAVSLVPATIAAGATAQYTVTGLTGSLQSADTEVRVAAAATATAPDDTLAPPDADTDVDQLDGLSSEAVATLETLSVTTEILRGATPTTEVRRNEDVTIRVTVTHSMPTNVTLTGITLPTRTGLDGTAAAPAPALSAVAAGTHVFTITGLRGSTTRTDTSVSAAAAVAGTVPDDTLLPADADTDPEAVSGTSTAATAALVNFTVTVQLRRGADPATAVPAAGFIAGDPATLRVTITNSFDDPLTIAPGAVAVTATNLGSGAPSPGATVAANTTGTIDITGFVAGPGSLASASVTVNGTLPDNTLQPNDGGGADDAAAASSPQVTAPVGTLSVTTTLLRGTDPSAVFLAGEAVTVKVTITSDLPAAYTIAAGGVTLPTRNNLNGTASLNAETVIAAGPRSTDVEITGLTAGTAGSPIEVISSVTGTMPDDTLSIDADTTADSLTRTSPQVTATVVAPTLSFVGTPTPPGPVERNSTIVVASTFANPAGAPLISAGTLNVEVPTGTTITAASVAISLLGGPFGAEVPVTPTPTGPVVSIPVVNVAGAASYRLTVTTTVNSNATPVDAADDLVFETTFESLVLPLVPTAANLAYEITSADLQMTVDAPAGPEQLDPTTVDIPVTYTVDNTGGDPAAVVAFNAPAPAGAVVKEFNAPAGWTCVPATGPATGLDCSLTGTLTAAATPPVITITWTVNTTGTITFTATVTSLTHDPATGNNTGTDSVAVTVPETTIVLSSEAVAPVIVASDISATVVVDYKITNSGKKNINVLMTFAAPPGGTLDSVTNASNCTPTLPTALATTCKVGPVPKASNPGDVPGVVTVRATYVNVPQSAFDDAADVNGDLDPGIATFSATIAPDGGTFAAGSDTTEAAPVDGNTPQVDIAILGVPNTVDNFSFDAEPEGVALDVSRTFTFQNLSEYSVLAGNSPAIQFTLPPGVTIAPPVTSGDPPVVTSTPNPTCTANRCTVTAPVPAGSPGTPGVTTLTVHFKVATPLQVTITAAVVMTETINRKLVPNSDANDSTSFNIDINRTPSLASEVGPAIPAGGVLRLTPVGAGALHEDREADPITIAVPDPAPACEATGVVCSTSGGTVTGLTYAITNNVLTVTFSGTAVPTVEGEPVTATISYTVSDAKSIGASSLTVGLLPPVEVDPVPGSFGTPPDQLPVRSFGNEVPAADLGTSATTIEVLEGARGLDANGDPYPAGRTYNVLEADVIPPAPATTSLNVEPGADSGVGRLPLEPAAPKTAIQYIPRRGYTSDAPSNANVPSEAPPDSFVYRTQGRKGTVSIFQVDIPVRNIEILNQNPIGIDSLFDVPNGVTQKVFPAGNDIDGNTVEDRIPTKVPAGEFLFDDEGDVFDPDSTVEEEKLDRRLTISCLGPMKPADELQSFLDTALPFNVCPSDETEAPAAGWKRPGEPLVLGTVENDRGTVTVTLDKTDADAFRGVTITADATVRGELDFMYIVVDNYGGASFAKATAKVPNTPPQVIEGVRTVLKNTPTVVVDTRLAAQDLNNDSIEVSGTSDPEHGSTQIGDNNRTITYTPDRDYLGPDKLVYNVTDGRADGAASAELQLNVIEQPSVLPEGGTGSAAGGGGSPAGNLAATGGDPLPLTAAAGVALVLGLALVQAGRRRQSLPLLERARHLRT